MENTLTVSFAATTEKQLRKQIDRSLGRAVVDGEYAQLLLADPTVAVEEFGCAPQQYKTLGSIHAIDLVDFARQAEALFWIVESQRTPLRERDAQLAAAR